MATSNFWVENANGYYAFNDTYEVENDEGMAEMVQRDRYDWDSLMEDIAYRGQIDGTFPICSENKWNRKMEAREICETETDWQTFGNGRLGYTETDIESTIVIRGGYYEGAVLDYEIKVSACTGEEFLLSDYDSLDGMLEDYLSTIEDNMSWRGVESWEVGLFKMQRKNISKWFLKRMEKEIGKCEDFCKSNCEMELRVYARFSNGETWYSKVG